MEEKKDWRERIDINIDKEPYEITLDGQPIRCVNHLEKWVEKILEQELDKAREEGYEQCKKDFIGNFCDVADRPLVISKSAVKEMFRVLEYGKNLWADNLKTKEDEK